MRFSNKEIAFGTREFCGTLTLKFIFRLSHPFELPLKSLVKEEHVKNSSQYV